MSKTFQDFFGDSTTEADGAITFYPEDIFNALAILTGRPTEGLEEATNPNHVITALLFYWFLTNYKDETTGIRLSEDKTVPLSVPTEKPRVSLTTRQEENQFRHTLSFDIYTDANSGFSPSKLVSGN